MYDLNFINSGCRIFLANGRIFRSAQKSFPEPATSSLILLFRIDHVRDTKAGGHAAVFCISFYFFIFLAGSE
jgi:hypothetical protein